MNPKERRRQIEFDWCDATIWEKFSFYNAGYLLIPFQMTFKKIYIFVSKGAYHFSSYTHSQIEKWRTRGKKWNSFICNISKGHDGECILLYSWSYVSLSWIWFPIENLSFPLLGIFPSLEKYGGAIFWTMMSPALVF